jgi:hypothetical protein
VGRPARGSVRRANHTLPAGREPPVRRASGHDLRA